jgi:hypothetical protein
MSMPPRHSEATKFLRDALAVDALGVPKLEAMARLAGLLREGHRITQAKPFRRAKALLRIRSIRDGFGRGGGWSWELPRSSEGRAPTPSPIGPPLARKERSIPREWVEGVAQLEQHRPPADVPRHRWHQFVGDCNAFLNSPEAERAAQLGWHTMQLFGCKPRYPLSYLGEAGLLWHVNGGKIIELHRTWAVIDDPVNRSPRTFSRRDVAKERMVLPWMLD